MGSPQTSIVWSEYLKAVLARKGVTTEGGPGTEGRDRRGSSLPALLSLKPHLSTLPPRYTEGL